MGHLLVWVVAGPASSGTEATDAARRPRDRRFLQENDLFHVLMVKRLNFQIMTEKPVFSNIEAQSR